MLINGFIWKGDQITSVVAGFHADAIHYDIGYLSANFGGGEGDPNNYKPCK